MEARRPAAFGVNAALHFSGVMDDVGTGVGVPLGVGFSAYTLGYVLGVEICIYLFRLNYTLLYLIV